MSLPWWLFGLRGPGPGAFRLQGEASPWCSPTEQDISLQQESVRVNSPLCVCPPLVCPQRSHSCCQPPPPPPGTPPRRAARSAPGPYEVAAQVRDLCGHPPRAKSASPALWSSCIQAPLPFRAKGSGGASSGRWSAGWSPAWDSAHSLLGLQSLQSHPPTPGSGSPAQLMQALVVPQVPPPAVLS